MVETSSPQPRIYDEEDFRRLLAWEVQRATRYQDFLSLCLMQPEPPGAAGGGILDAMARRVVELLRATDIVALLGSRIAIMLVHTPDSDARIITERVRGMLESATSVLSLGLASFPMDATDERVLLDQAEARLSTARRRIDA